MDLAVLRRCLISIPSRSHTNFTKIIVRKEYFRYEAFLRVLDILLEANDITKVEQTCIWLLLATKHLGF